jgi:hypothetical protein
MTNALPHLNLSHEDYHRQDQIRVGDGTSLPISYIGCASLNLSPCFFILNQLLRLPLICKNLISIRQFALDNSVFFEFHSSHFVIKDSQEINMPNSTSHMDTPPARVHPMHTRSMN